MTRLLAALAMAVGLLAFQAIVPHPAVARPVTVTILDVEQFGFDFDEDSYGEFYADVTIDGTTVSSFDDQLSNPAELFVVPLYPSGPLLQHPWVLTRNVPDGATSVAIRISILDDDTPDDNDRADINPGGKNVIDLVLDLQTGTWSGDVNWPQSCVSGGGVSNPLSVGICFDISALSTTGDADEDGLLDGWESLGYDADGDGNVDVDLPGLGASPLRRDLFVEVDCLSAADHDHCPMSAAMEDVVTAFAEAPVLNPDGTTGVQLHVDIGNPVANTRVDVTGTGGVTGSYGDLGGGGTRIPELGNEVILSFDAPAGTVGTDPIDLRVANFDPRRNRVFRYAIFGHQTNPEFSCVSGNAVLPGRSLLVTLGGRRGGPNGIPCYPSFLGSTSPSVGMQDEQAGAFMHELGHTLGLRHAGDQAPHNGREINFKPNYLSVMNYLMWACSVPSRPEGGLPGFCDYSRADLPDVDEQAVDECAGQDGGVYGLGSFDFNDDSKSSGATCPAPDNINLIIDTNRDGVCVAPGGNGLLDSTPSATDLVDGTTVFDDFDRICATAKGGDDVLVTPIGNTPDQPRFLTGFDDWSTLHYSVLTLEYRDTGAGAAVSEPTLDEIEGVRRYVATLTAPALVVEKTGPATGKPGDVLEYTVAVRNSGRGPALVPALIDTAPDGAVEAADLDIVRRGATVTRTSASFTVPTDACPGDFTSTAASVAFRDTVGNDFTASDTLPLEILDVSAPRLTVTLSPAVLFPSPNHKLETVTATISVSDDCDASPTIVLTSVTSSEPAVGYIGAGDKGPDVGEAAVGTDDRSFQVRTERATSAKSPGRTYTATYRATDAAGNFTDASATVLIPRNSSR